MEQHGDRLRTKSCVGVRVGLSVRVLMFIILSSGGLFGFGRVGMLCAYVESCVLSIRLSVRVDQNRFDTGKRVDECVH